MTSTPRSLAPGPLSLRLLCTLIAALPLLASAQSGWKWKDAQGLHYSDLPPPPGTPASAILQRPRDVAPPRAAAASPMAASAAPAASAPEGAASAADPTLEARRKQAEQAEAEKKKAEEAGLARQRATNCERARGYLRSLDSGQRVVRTNPNGEREFLDDATRARESAQARQAVSSNCR